MKEDVIFAIQKFVGLLYNYKLSWLGTHAHFLWYLNIGGRFFCSCGVGDGPSVPLYLMSAQVDWIWEIWRSGHCIRLLVFFFSRANLQ